MLTLALDLLVVHHPDVASAGQLPTDEVSPDGVRPGDGLVLVLAVFLAIVLIAAALRAAGRGR